jgi:putative membrane protein
MTRRPAARTMRGNERSLIMSTLAAVLPFADDHWDGPGPWIVFPLFWALAIFAFAWFVRGWGGGPRRRTWPPREPDRETAAEILDRRFAQGEIDVEEYRDRRSELDAQSGP